MNDLKQHRTFISYSRRDKGFALEFARELKSAGHLVWLDQLDIPAGARWDDEVEKALRESEIFLIVLTPASVSSENVKDEIGYAIDHSKRILPILLEECEVPLRLRRFQYIDFTKMEFCEGVKGASQLIETLVNEWVIPKMEASPAHEPQMTSEKEAKFTSLLTNQNKHIRHRWIIGGTGILALTAFLGALGAIIILKGFTFPQVSAPQAQVLPAVTQIEKVTPMSTSILLTPTRIATLTATQPSARVPAVPIVNSPAWIGWVVNIAPENTVSQSFLTNGDIICNVDVDILTINPGRGSDVITLKILSANNEVLAETFQEVADGYTGWLRFSMPNGGLRVQSNVTLAIQLSDTGKTIFGWKYSNDTYADGMAFFYGSSEPSYDRFFRINFR